MSIASPSQMALRSASEGFTTADLIALGEVHAAAIARQLWSRGQLVAYEFAHYLAAWGPKPAPRSAGAGARPVQKTGTYVLTIGTTSSLAASV